MRIVLFVELDKIGMIINHLLVAFHMLNDYHLLQNQD